MDDTVDTDEDDTEDGWDLIVGGLLYRWYRWMDDALIDGRIDTTEDRLSAACWIPAWMDVPC